MKRNSKRQQALDAELGLIIDEMGQAMWNANRSYIADNLCPGDPMNVCLTFNMRYALRKFKKFCEEYYGK